MAYCPGTFMLCFDQKSFLIWSHSKNCKAKRLHGFRCLKKWKKTRKLHLEAETGEGICIHDLKAVVRLLLLLLLIMIMLIFLCVWTVLSVWEQKEKWPLLLSGRTDSLGSAAIRNDWFHRYQRTVKSGWLIPVAITKSSYTMGKKVKFDRSSI